MAGIITQVKVVWESLIHVRAGMAFSAFSLVLFRGTSRRHPDSSEAPDHMSCEPINVPDKRVDRICECFGYVIFKPLTCATAVLE
jgi:hypothetical protein